MTDPVWTTGEIRLLFIGMAVFAVAIVAAAYFGERLLGMDKDD